MSADLQHYLIGLAGGAVLVWATYAIANAITGRIIERRRRRLARALGMVTPVRVRKVDEEVRRG